MGLIPRRLRWLAPLLATSGLAVASPAAAAPILVSEGTDAGGGRVRHDISVDFQDGLARSGFIQITFSSASSSFHPTSSLTLANWPDIQSSQTDPGIYTLQGGTGGGSQVDVVEVARLVVPADESISYSGIVSRDGRNFVVVPEPGAAATAACALAVMAALRAFGPRRRGPG